MNHYYECIKCGTSFIYNGNKIPSICGTFIKVAIVYGEMMAIGCGGGISEITEEQANLKIEQLRS